MFLRPPSPNPTPTYPHPTPLSTLAPFLTPHLPRSLPLLRRLQYTHSSPHAHIFATLHPSTLSPLQKQKQTHSHNSTHCFAALYADRTLFPETEAYFFSTYETLPPAQQAEETTKAEASKQLLALLHAVAVADTEVGLPGGGSGSEVMVLGSVNECLLELIGGERVRGMKPVAVVSRKSVRIGDGDREEEGGGRGAGAGSLRDISVPYRKWLIAAPSSPSALLSSSEEIALPDGYHFDTVRAERGEFKLVRSRTEIPRTEESLARMGCVGVRFTGDGGASVASEGQGDEEARAEQGDLIAWAFLGTQGSLSSLHVEPAHRGKGLAKAVARKLVMRLAREPEAVGFRRVEGIEGMATSDVALENVQSAGVAMALGGREGWVVRWVGVDLRCVREAVGNELE